MTNSCHLWSLFEYLSYAMAQNSIWTNKSFLTYFVKLSYFSIKWCPCSYRKGEPLTLNPLDITNFQLYLKQNGRPWLALTNKNFCSKSIFDEVIAFWKRWKVTRTPCKYPAKNSWNHFYRVGMIFGVKYTPAGEYFIPP